MSYLSFTIFSGFYLVGNLRKLSEFNMLLPKALTIFSFLYYLFEKPPLAMLEWQFEDFLEDFFLKNCMGWCPPLGNFMEVFKQEDVIWSWT